MDLENINELTRKAYKQTAAKYHDNFKNEIQQKEYDRDLLDNFSCLTGMGSYILDAGCGPSGNFTAYMYSKGHKVMGIDLSPECVKLARENNPTLDFRVLDMMDTGLESNTFDGILSYYSILYTPKKFVPDIFQEFRRILKPGGLLLIAVKKGVAEGIIEDDWYEGNKVYFSLFTEEEISSYFTAACIKIEYMYTRKPYPFEINTDRIYCTGRKITG